MTTYGIRYYRDEETAKRFCEHTGRFRSVGWCTGRDRFTTQFEAQKLANHINNQKPAAPVTVVPSQDPATVKTFRTMVRWV